MVTSSYAYSPLRTDQFGGQPINPGGQRAFRTILTILVLLVISCIIFNLQPTQNNKYFRMYFYSLNQSISHKNLADSHNGLTSMTFDDDWFDGLVTSWRGKKVACRGPHPVDPWDETFTYYHEDMDWPCITDQPLTILNRVTGTLSVDLSRAGNHTCYYSYFRRGSADNYITYSEVAKFPEVTNPNKTVGVFLTPDKNMVNVSCYDQDGQRDYVNSHLYIPPFVTPESPSMDKPSVLVFFLESMSKISFERYLNETAQVMARMGNFDTFDYFVKPLDNSFPNTMAFLTGKRIDWPQEKELKKTYFDGKFEYLFQHFKKAGYTTAYLEDLAQVGVWNYGKWGFRKWPVDFCPRSFWVQMYPETGSFDINRAMNDPKEWCFASNGPKINYFMDQTVDYVKKNVKNLYFFFGFYSQVTHNDINAYQLADGPVADMLTRITPYLDNTIVLFAGDHGFRMGSNVHNILGRIEERMNFVSVRIPENVNRKYPHLRKFMAANKDRLVTWYDFYKMMLDISTGDFKKIGSPPIGLNNQAVNPSRQLVPPERTCQSANIDTVYCVCNDEVNLNPEGTYTDDMFKAVKAIQGQLDDLMAEVNKSSVMPCPYQTVNETVIAFKYFIPPGVSLWPIEKGLATVQLSPSKEIVKSYVFRDRRKAKWDFHIDDERNKVEGISLSEVVNKVCFG